MAKFPGQSINNDWSGFNKINSPDDRKHVNSIGLHGNNAQGCAQCKGPYIAHKKSSRKNVKPSVAQ